MLTEKQQESKHKAMTMRLKKIAIMGLGGVGGYYGSRLAATAIQEAKGRALYFIARGEHLDAIREHGLHVTTPTRDEYIRPSLVTDKPEDIGPVDLIILATKSYDLAESIQRIRPLVGKRTIILPLLNGAYISEQIQALLPETEVWQGCCYISARKPRAGHVLLERDRETLFFAKGEEAITETERELLDLMLRSEIHAIRPDNIRQVIREKYIMISTTATATSYYDKTVGTCLSEHPEVLRALLEEICAMYSAMGHDVSEATIEQALHRQAAMPPESTSSMHVDFIQGSRTELENLTGYVVSQSQALGLSAPYYSQMYNALLERSARG